MATSWRIQGKLSQRAGSRESLRQIYALVSALAAAVTALLIKMGVGVVGWGEYRQVMAMSRRTLLLLILSGLATGVSWLAYVNALKLGPASRVAAIDKLSLPFTVVMAFFLLGEPLTWRVAGGALLITAGALLATS